MATPQQSCLHQDIGLQLIRATEQEPSINESRINFIISKSNISTDRHC